MGYIFGIFVNFFVIIAALLIFGSLPGVFWGFVCALVVIVILAIRSGFNKPQPNPNSFDLTRPRE
jgi:polyferredoxin